MLWCKNEKKKVIFIFIVGAPPINIMGVQPFMHQNPHIQNNNPFDVKFGP
jgi:hypothetical protein